MYFLCKCLVHNLETYLYGRLLEYLTSWYQILSWDKYKNSETELLTFKLLECGMINIQKYVHCDVHNWTYLEIST